MDDADQKAIHAIQEYIDSHYPDEMLQKPDVDIMAYSFSKWALNEIQSRIVNGGGVPGRTPMVITLEFIAEMGYFWRSTKSVQNNTIFIVAKQAAEELLEILV